ncbi:hypothetical protein FOFC_02897 [Fusarium oxysporum]|nr:hypothetical protein FOFC_02897 [Fusarium oxysporum]
MFNIFFCSAESCLSSSAVYHLIGSHSHEAELLWHRRDLIGIVILTVGTFIPGIYYIFYCDPILQKIHWIIVVFCGSATAALISIPKFRTLRWRKARVSAYVALGASALIPLLHGAQVYGLEYMLEYSGMKWYLVELLLYGGGCGIYAVRTLSFPFPSGMSVMRQISDLGVQFRIPERIAPGHFDIWFSSHQIFHIKLDRNYHLHLLRLSHSRQWNMAHRHHSPATMGAHNRLWMISITFSLQEGSASRTNLFYGSLMVYGHLDLADLVVANILPLEGNVAKDDVENTDMPNTKT